jgi:hypothetical protein
MKYFRTFATILAVVFSVVFALLLYPEIVGQQGVLKSTVAVGLGVACIWLFYFMLGRLFSSIYAAGREDEKENNTDFI